MWVSKEIEVEVDIQDFDMGDLFDWVTELCNKTDVDLHRTMYVDDLKDNLGFNDISRLGDLIYAMDREKFEELLKIMHNDFKFLDGGINREC